jgi:hypothetical protein
MKKLLLLLTVIASIQVSAQNYQTVRSNQINYYGTPNLNYILATRTDSFDLSGLDSVFYSYKTIRNNDTASTTDCQYLVGPNWYGEKVIIKNNGENLFFNKDSDTIRIQTQAHFEDTFLVYVYPSGLDSIFATVINEDTLTILGVLDSVKSLQFFSTAGSFITPGQASFSKNHGFVDWFASYSFPLPYTGPMGQGIINYTGNYALVGHEFPRVGITKPRIGEIYDFEIGDRFIFNSGESDFGGNSSSLHTERTVTGKIVYGIDSVYYTYHDSTKLFEYFGFGDPFYTYGGNDYSVMYKALPDLNDTLLPEEFNFTTQYSWNYLSINDCGRLEETIYSTSISLLNWPTSNCVILHGLSWGESFKTSISGIGTLATYGYLNPGYSTHWNSSLGYYSKVDEDTCGTPGFLGLEAANQSNQPSFVIYPNPTSGDINLVIQSELSSNIELIITDLTGKLVYQENISEDQLASGLTISTENFESGIYFVSVANGVTSSSLKLIKQ